MLELVQLADRKNSRVGTFSGGMKRRLALGVTLGAALHKSQPVIAISINVAIYLFFLASGIGVIAFEPLWLQNIVAYIPLTYGIHALEQAVFYSSSDLLGRDMLVLGLCVLGHWVWESCLCDAVLQANPKVLLARRKELVVTLQRHYQF